VLLHLANLNFVPARAPSQRTVVHVVVSRVLLYTSAVG